MNYITKLLLVLTLLVFSCNQQTKFDSDEWKNSIGEVTTDIRLNMTNDLIESKILINKSESEVIELIGKSSKLNEIEVEKTEYFEVQEIYGIDIDPEEMIFLKIRFNNQEKVKSVELYSTK